MHQTVFYLHAARHDDHDYAVPLETGTAAAVIDEAAERLLEQLVDQLIDDARRAGDQPVGGGA